MNRTTAFRESLASKSFEALPLQRGILISLLASHSYHHHPVTPLTRFILSATKLIVNITHTPPPWETIAPSRAPLQLG